MTYYCRAGNEISCDTLAGLWQMPAYRRVAYDALPHGDVETSWLGIDHRLEDGEPLIFETVVIGGPIDNQTILSSSEDEAKRNHQRMVSRVVATQAGVIE